MPSTYKKLFGVALSVTSLTDAYTAGAGVTAVISTLSVCNRSGTATTFRISHATGGAADNANQYLFFDAPIGANSTIMITVGMCVAPADIIRAYAGGGALTVMAWGEERT